MRAVILVHVVPVPVQALQQPQRLRNRTEVRDLVRRVPVEDRRHAERTKAATSEPAVTLASEAMRPLEELFIPNREERTAQRCKDRKLVVRPLDRGEGGANGLDFLALVKSLAPDEDVRDPTRLEGLDVRARNVRFPTHEATKQQADVLGCDFDRRAAA